ncbi:hypothetical protein Btru_000268 [Bulinus truncatus]|nr:hypothetical protein Btru_000268 [Bulinus truncatus]
MGHGIHSAWTLPLIIYILYNKQHLMQCSGVNCYHVNGRLDNISYDINTLPFFIIQLHDGQYPAPTHLHKDYNVRKPNSSDNIFKFHLCCKNQSTTSVELKFHPSLFAHCFITNGNNDYRNDQINNWLASFLFNNNSRDRNVGHKANNEGSKMCNDTKCNKLNRQTRQVICEPFLFGQSCSHECHCAQLRPCNTSEGHCPFDLCYLGWQRPNCSVRSCNTDSFIIYPKGECHPCGCKSGTTCNILTGECDSQCESEPDCRRQTCQRHMFSPTNCNKKCYCRAQSECHPVTGECRIESCSQPDVNPPTCSQDLGDGHLWETASALMILSSFFLIKFITFLIY